MSRLRGLMLGRFRVVVAAIVTVSELPAILWACAVTGTPIPAVVALLLAAPYLARLDSPWAQVERGLMSHLALGTWSTCLVFDLLMFPSWLVVRAGAPSSWVWSAAVALAAALGIDSVLAGPRLKRRTVWIEGLPPALDGYRIGQLSDVHCGHHASEARVAGWVRRLNAQKLDLAAVTGDLIVHGGDHVEAVSRALGGLKARDGAFVSMGNHDYFTDGEQFVHTLERYGLRVLRNQGVVLRREDAALFVAGADDTWTKRQDVAKALSDRPDGAPAVLLAHDPNLFAEAQRLGVELTLSGHTHGGQIAVPGLRKFSLARLITRWTAGLYRQGRSWLYVNRGAGTTGPPIRLGAPAELTVLTLRCARA